MITSGALPIAIVGDYSDIDRVSTQDGRTLGDLTYIAGLIPQNALRPSGSRDGSAA
jgi:hypothetical protein